MSIITENLLSIQSQIEIAALSCGRDPKSILLMPVTKTIEPERILEVIRQGYFLIGENKVQEVQAKASALENTPHKTHLIGHLQTNKVKDVISKVSCIQSLDSIKLASKLQNRLEYENREIDVYIEVNTSGEKAKTGIDPETVDALLDEVVTMERIRVMGLMTIGANTDNEAKVRSCFRELVNIQEKSREKYGDKANFDALSMGMSHDFKWAIEEGSTLVRVGSAIFGPRLSR